MGSSASWSAGEGASTGKSVFGVGVNRRSTSTAQRAQNPRCWWSDNWQSAAISGELPTSIGIKRVRRRRRVAG